MKAHGIIAIVFAMLHMVSVVGYCQQTEELFETIGTGGINWTKGTLQAKGIGIPPDHPQARSMALRSAQVDAYRNLMEVIMAVRIDAKTTLKRFAAQSDVIMSKVEEMVRGSRVVKQEYLSDGTVEVTLEMDMTGGFAQLVLPRDIKQVESVKPLYPQGKTSNDPSQGSKQQDASKVSGIYTGMIVDAKGLNANPALSPTILDENGQEVYGAAYVSREHAVQQGMSGYTKNIDAAIQHQRVSGNPLIVKGLKTEGPDRSDIIISNSDAAKLRSASENLLFMKKCRVMIVVD